uniref:ubiquitinyl hydrolase 1 n=1 Tax=Macrostomum lignano TaxID=282301 RepID=A0A1I8JN20_9PLAT
TEEGHPLCINLRNKRFWCSKCKCEVFEHGNTPQFCAAQILPPVSRTRSGGRPAAAESSSDEEAEPESLGLTGLRNLGNTCYMNAAVQALSHCRQLTRFFLDCPGLARPGRFAARSLGTPLCSAYAAYWPICVHATGASGIPQLAQQDTQEFLRCFMDQLHEELKRPLAAAAPVGEEDDDGGGNSGNGGGGDVNSDGGASAGVADGADSTAAGAALAPGSAAPMAASPSANSLVSSTEASASAGGAATTVEDCGNADQGSVGPGEGAVKRRFNSIISDIFNGSLVSTVQCNSCESLSSTLEDCLDAFFSNDDLKVSVRIYVRIDIGVGSDIDIGVGSDIDIGVGSDIDIGVGSDIDIGVSSDIDIGVGSDIDIGVRSESDSSGSGDNMYHCAKCGKLRNGIKYSRISRLPEMLTASSQTVQARLCLLEQNPLTLDELDMKPYLHRDCRAAQTVYDLTAVVVPSRLDKRAGTTPRSRSTTPHAVVRVRRRPSQGPLMSALWSARRPTCCFIGLVQPHAILHSPGLWLNKFNTFGDPGQLATKDFLCPHHLLSPHTSGDAPPYRAWDILDDRVRGGPTVNRLGPLRSAPRDLERTRRPRPPGAGHTDQGAAAFSARQPGLGRLYCISMRWFRKWESFATEKQLEPPGPIDKQRHLCCGRGNRLLPRANSDLCSRSACGTSSLPLILGLYLPDTPSAATQQEQQQQQQQQQSSNGGSVSGGGNDESRCSGNESETGRCTDASARAAALDADKD